MEKKKSSDQLTGNKLIGLLDELSGYKGMLDSALKRVNDEDTVSSYGQALVGSGLKQWMRWGDKYKPVGEIVLSDKLPAGWYKFKYIEGHGPAPCPVTMKNEELLNLPNPMFQSVIKDVDTFWAKAADYDKYGFPKKRGVLLYGSPGTGKSALASQIGDKLIKQHDGIVFLLDNPDDIYAYEQVFTQLREIEPDRKVVTVFEDIDNFAKYGGSLYSKLLNILDGAMNHDNVVFLATTNFPELLMSNLTNRPSRFDRVYTVESPTAEAREFYIRKKFPAVPDAEVNKIVTSTDGFTLDMLKELVLSVYVLDIPLDEVIQMMGNMFKTMDAVEFKTHMKPLQDSTGKKALEASLTVKRKRDAE